jgi:hypothetical protein
MLYKSSTRSLTQALHADIPRAMAALAKMMESLEQYADVPPPQEPLPEDPLPERGPEQERPQ